MEQNSNNQILPKTRKEIAVEYNTTVKIINSQIEHYKLDIAEGVLLFPKQQKMIYEVLGYPNCVNPNDYKNV
jgi:hypothetical protein